MDLLTAANTRRVTLNASACTTNGRTPDLTRPAHVQLRLAFPTLEEAQAVAATFPKGAKARAGTLSHGGGITTAWVEVDAKLIANGTHGAVNETGIRRVRQALRHVEGTLGLTPEWTAHYGNSYPTREEFTAAAGL